MVARRLAVRRPKVVTQDLSDKVRMRLLVSMPVDTRLSRQPCNSSAIEALPLRHLLPA
jgi:hypothetical protein